MIGLLAAVTLFAALNNAPPSRDLCQQFIRAKRLPETFQQLAAGELVKGEFIVMSDGRCTCDNIPAVNRWNGKPVPAGDNWHCRQSTDEERKDLQ